MPLMCLILSHNSLRTEILIPTISGSAGGWQCSATSLSGKCPWLKRHSPKDHVSAHGSGHPVTTDVGLKRPATCLYSGRHWGAIWTLEVPWGIVWNFCWGYSKIQLLFLSILLHLPPAEVLIKTAFPVNFLHAHFYLSVHYLGHSSCVFTTAGYLTDRIYHG